MNTNKRLGLCLLSLKAIAILLIAQPTVAQDVAALKSSGKLIVEDDFDRDQVGTAWVSNDGRALRTSKTPKSDFEPQLKIKNNALQESVIRPKNASLCPCPARWRWMTSRSGGSQPPRRRVPRTNNLTSLR
jgi:hypothetical protein